MRHGAARLAVGLALAAGAGSLGCDRTEAASEDPVGPAAVTYAVCQGNLAGLEILPPRRAGDAHAIAAQLDRDATAELERLTGENIGATLEIILGERIFVKGPIQAALRSGLVVNNAFASREQAEDWLRVLSSELPEEPCGSGARGVRPAGAG